MGYSKSAERGIKARLTLGREHGVAKEEAVEIVTQLAFYCGWPKAWSAFLLIAEVYGKEDKIVPALTLPIGEPNNAFAQYFIGQREG